MAEWRVGLVGCGFISKQHLQAWQNNADVEVVALCDIHREKAQIRASEFGIERVYCDAQNMFQREHPDVVDIVTPVNTHRSIVTAAAGHRIHVLCEKPFAVTLSEGQAMIDSCEKNEVKLMIMQNMRWWPCFVAIKTAVKEGEIGCPFYASISQRIHYAVPSGPKGEIELQHLQPFYTTFDRLVMLEMASHHIDLMRFLFGEPSSIYAQMRHISACVKGDDLTTIVLNFGEMLGVIENSWCSLGPEIRSRTRIEGKEGTIYLDGEGQKPELYIYKRSDTIVGEIESGDYFVKGFESAQRHFLKCIAAKTTPETSGRDNLRTLELTLRAYESAENNRVIRLKSSRSTMCY